MHRRNPIPLGLAAALATAAAATLPPPAQAAACPPAGWRLVTSRGEEMTTLAAASAGVVCNAVWTRSGQSGMARTVAHGAPAPSDAATLARLGRAVAAALAGGPPEPAFVDAPGPMTGSPPAWHQARRAGAERLRIGGREFDAVVVEYATWPAIDPMQVYRTRTWIDRASGLPLRWQGELLGPATVAEATPIGSWEAMVLEAPRAP
jgi:hypothetical protein